MKIYIATEHMGANAVPRDMGDMVLGVFLDREKAKERVLALRSYYLWGLGA